MVLEFNLLKIKSIRLEMITSSSMLFYCLFFLKIRVLTTPFRANAHLATTLSFVFSLWIRNGGYGYFDFGMFFVIVLPQTQKECCFRVRSFAISPG